MKFFDGIIGKAGNAADYAIKKGGEVTASAKLRVQIHTVTAQLAKLYENLGRAYFDGAVNEADSAADIGDYIQQIKESEAELARLNEELASAQGFVICPQCKGQVDKTFTFCPKCGAKLPVKEEAPAEVEEAEEDDEAPAEEAETEEAEVPAEEQPAEEAEAPAEEQPEAPAAEDAPADENPQA